MNSVPHSENVLVVVVGATAVGKTQFCIQLAQHFETEIISADARQFYQEMSIGTAKPTPKECQQAPHHFIDSHSIHALFSTGKYEKEALQKIDELFKKKSLVLLTGGSGLYIRAVCEGLDKMPEISPQLRENLKQRFKTQGLESLTQELQNLDPNYYKQVDLRNPQRVIRALEVCLTTGLPYSHFRKTKPKKRPFQILKIGLYEDREILYQRINQRADKMLEIGLLEEVQKLYPFRDLNALQTVGYSEFFNYLDEKYDWEEAVRLFKRNTRRYAKRQMTWFKKDAEITWFRPSEIEEVINFITKSISNKA